jgi:hypothetical protein
MDAIQLSPRREVVQHGTFAFRGDLSLKMRHDEYAPRLERIKLAGSQIPAELSRHVAFVQRPQFRKYRSVALREAFRVLQLRRHPERTRVVDQSYLPLCDGRLSPETDA